MAGFRIAYTKEGGATEVIDVGVMATYTLTSLEKNTIYNATVSVRNTLYLGQPSVEVKKKTLEDGNLHQLINDNKYMYLAIRLQVQGFYRLIVLIISKY
jgi:hypothetical protein